jgi:ParB-like chromosome segregation protein Spo0J
MHISLHTHDAVGARMKISNYQLLPPLLPDEFDSLKASIAERGVDVQIIVDEDGNIIDGFHRHRACDELGIFCPREVRQFDSETDKLELILRTNCGRRHLSQNQKRSIIEQSLLRDPQIADNFLAQIIGVSKNTVADVRSEMEATCQIDKFDTLRGRDGKQRPVKYKKIVANTPKETENALKFISDLPDNCAGKIIDITTATRRAKRSLKKREREQKRQQWTGLPVNSTTLRERIRMIHCRFQKLEQQAALQRESVQLAFGDIPYDRGFLPQVADLADLAQRVLVPGGILAVMSGVVWENETIASIPKSFTRLHRLIAPWKGDGNVLRINGMRVINHYKPVLIFSKGTPNRSITIGNDVLPEADQQKYWHDWQQPLPHIDKIIQYFSDEHDLILDGCGGGFTTSISCLHNNRRFIGCDVDEHCVQAGRVRLGLNENLDAYIYDMHDMDDPVDSEAIITKWAVSNGVDSECASHVLSDMPDETRSLVIKTQTA